MTPSDSNSTNGLASGSMPAPPAEEGREPPLPFPALGAARVLPLGPDTGAGADIGRETKGAADLLQPTGRLCPTHVRAYELGWLERSGVGDLIRLQHLSRPCLSSCWCAANRCATVPSFSRVAQSNESSLERRDDRTAMRCDTLGAMQQPQRTNAEGSAETTVHWDEGWDERGSR